MVRDKEYDYDGHYGFAPEIFEFVDIKIIKSGEFSTPEPCYLKGKSPKEASADYPNVSDSAGAKTDGGDRYPF